ncbi:hypothetical protein SULYE_1669 [Sulfurihydrogenibium yellowstonense SS-5]|uniref:Uncharacterized protein n=1 Tax=Sulfurihydrogenibium yellowstonense SS-5 TaxID=432331 RepID=C4FM65_9AQUI|nr:hypothetical protein SULYE_1669 [Sulfurihydrogenibium yellowstonense SS-5]
MATRTRLSNPHGSDVTKTHSHFRPKKNILSNPHGSDVTKTKEVS